MSEKKQKVIDNRPLKRNNVKNKSICEANSFIDIGIEILYILCTYLNAIDLLSLSQTCSFLQKLACRNSLWRRRCKLTFTIDVHELPKTIKSFKDLYCIFHHLDFIKGFDFTWERWLNNYSSDAIAGILLDKKSTFSTPTRVCCMEPKYVKQLWQFTEEEFPEHKVVKDKQGHTIHLLKRYYGWDELYSNAMKLYGKQQWQMKGIKRQCAGKEQLWHGIYHKDHNKCGLIFQKRRTAFNKWHMIQNSLPEKESLIPPLKYGHNSDPMSFYGHNLIKNEYMDGKLFRGLATVVNYAKFCRQLKKFIIAFPLTRKSSSVTTMIYQDCLKLTVNQLRKAMYVDLVSEDRMLRHGKKFVRRAVEIFKQLGGDANKWNSVRKQHPYRKYLLDPSLEFHNAILLGLQK